MNDATAWKWQNRADFKTSKHRLDDEAWWVFEPGVALKIYEGWISRDNIEIIKNERLDRKNGLLVAAEGMAEGAGRRIAGFRTESGREFRGRVFIDATYEGDLMALAGVSHTIGREANATYKETLNGVQTLNSKTHNFRPGVDPYIIKGDPASGLLPFIDPTGPGVEGAADKRLQAYCFRLCLTNNPENRMPFEKPDGYREDWYELLFRNFEAGLARVPWINSPMPNAKTDTNNRDGFSTDFIGRNYDYPEADYATRGKITKQHLLYTQGLMWTLANHPRVPQKIRDDVSQWGVTRDEFVETGGWPGQLYIREARRMIGALVMTQHHCLGGERAYDSIGMAAYTMDSHSTQRYVNKDGHVRNEGCIEKKGFPPYPVSYRALVPKQAECANLIVPVAMSASHIAYGSIRMEPVFMVFGQSAATAASLAIDDNIPVQKVSYAKLRQRLVLDGQVLGQAAAEPPSAPSSPIAQEDIRVAGLTPAIAALLKRPANPDDAGAQARRLVALMTPEERFEMVSAGNNFGISAVPRLGVPPVNFADASAGIRIIGKTPTAVYKQTTAFPAPVLLASAWDAGLAHDYARAIGGEMRAGGVHVLLGPGGSIYRMSRTGRNFEYFGEDPFLASRMVENYVRGLQSTGVAATLKPFIGNETELYRRVSNSIIDDRALREIYMPPYKAGVDAGAWAVMTAYNQLNGEWTGQSSKVINGLLRGELGFKWLCMTDWNSTWDGVELADSGQDLEKPGGFSLRRAKDQLLGSLQIDRMVISIFKTCIAAGLYDKNFRRPELMERWDEREAVARKTNERGIILLHNNGLLPLAAKDAGGSILVTGVNATREELSGRGSGHVRGYNNKSYAQAVAETFKAGVVVAENPTDEQIRSASLVFVFAGFALTGQPKEGEGGKDRTFAMPDDALTERCARLNKNTIVSIVSGGAVAMDWASSAAAILQVSYGGQTGAAVLMDILTGKINPSGKLPYTFEKKFEDSPAFGYDREPLEISGMRPVTDFTPSKVSSLLLNKEKTMAKIYNVHYKEGIFTGYRWFDMKKIEVRYPFGHGLSYTTFEYKNIRLEKQSGGEVTVSMTLTNTGKRDGAEIAQLYVSDLESSVPRPPRELKAFERVALSAGESRTVTFRLDAAAFSYWDKNIRDWRLEPGEFEIQIGSSSRDLPLRARVRL
ncbi:MAG: FAD-dependent oxidoreductase [Opitutaceae bacterium]|jgi:beta-glucosidase|nr:FAD-dependent oxidoreductase [Opitutaceae bacterium]